MIVLKKPHGVEIDGILVSPEKGTQNQFRLKLPALASHPVKSAPTGVTFLSADPTLDPSTAVRWIEICGDHSVKVRSCYHRVHNPWTSRLPYQLYCDVVRKLLEKHAGFSLLPYWVDSRNYPGDLFIYIESATTPGNYSFGDLLDDATKLMNDVETETIRIERAFASLLKKHGISL